MSDESSSERFNRFCREQKAATENGERCWQCGQWIDLLRPPGRRQLCLDCKAADKPEAFRHDTRLRCPKCRHSWDAYADADYDIFVEGEHEVTCAECEHKFEVSTAVHHNFRSPELIQKKADFWTRW